MRFYLEKYIAIKRLCPSSVIPVMQIWVCESIIQIYKFLISYIFKFNCRLWKLWKRIPLFTSLCQHNACLANRQNKGSLRMYTYFKIYEYGIPQYTSTIGCMCLCECTLHTIRLSQMHVHECISDTLVCHSLAQI